MILFKYTTKENAKKIVNDGSFMIGTLYDYRNIEKYSQGIADKEEGIKHTEMQGEPLINNHPQLSNRTQRILRQRFNFIEQQNVNTLTEDSPNMYIFSVSEVLSFQVMKDIN